MKTRLKIILPASIILIALVGVAIAALALPRSLAPEQEERISYDKDQQVALIDSQLAGIDLESPCEKDLIMEKSIEDLHAAISRGDLTYEELTAFYLNRIKTYDAGEKGINAVAAINPKAIEEARALDASSATPAGMRGIPVLVKDNVNTNTMPTSGGTYALKDFTPKDDADVVTALTNSGAIILGKSNLSELANFMDTKMPSGYSSKAGQTHNPFDPLNLSPEGSSFGSGAAAASNPLRSSAGEKPFRSDRLQPEDPSRRAKYGQDLLEDANEVTEFDKAKVEAEVKTAQSRIDDLLRDELDALVFYDNEGVLVPTTAGYPELTVPAGVSDEGAPRGATFVAGRNEDEKLLNIAYSFEQKTAARAIPENYLN